ncbi:MAG: hypothetical protein JJE15_14680, partial [Desulfobacteraceae bacterium]|nr:hypothetical protein [Desulfobacteraceae bacterium]
MKRKIWTLILLSTVAIFVLAACSPAATPTEEVSVEPTEAMAEPTEAVAEPTEAMAEPT